MELLMRASWLAVVLLASGCFNVDEPLCSFACGPMGECPDDYKCGPDNYCHLHGNTQPCGFSDASVPDLSMSMDMTATPDLTVTDGPVSVEASVDLAHADLTMQQDGPPTGLDGPMSDLTLGCFDGVKNGSETDIDCGGSCAKKCALTQGCMNGGDCTSGFCGAISKVCVADQCHDQTKNGVESDVDCGGGTCPTCPLGKMCGAPSDCTSTFCNTTCVSCTPATDCASPPADTCTGKTRNVHPNPGTCNGDGTCNYLPTSPMSCPDGCFAGACTTPFTSVGSTTAKVTTGGASLALDTTTSNGTSTAGGPAPSTSSVTVNTTVVQGGTAQSVTLVWSLDPTMALANQNPVSMTSTGGSASAETFTGVIPAQTAGTEVYFYIDAHPYTGADGFDPTGFGIHYAYAVN
jgi:hypothetical protein